MKKKCGNCAWWQPDRSRENGACSKILQMIYRKKNPDDFPERTAKSMTIYTFDAKASIWFVTGNKFKCGYYHNPGESLEASAVLAVGDGGVRKP